MEGKSGPPEERRIAHETKKKEKRKGNSGPSGSRESHAEAKLRIRNPDDLPPMYRRENAHSTTTHEHDARCADAPNEKRKDAATERWHLHPKTESKTTAAELCAWYSFRLHSSVANNLSD